VYSAVSWLHCLPPRRAALVQFAISLYRLAATFSVRHAGLLV